MQLATRFAHRNTAYIQSREPLTDDQLRAVVPSAFAAEKHEGRSARYTYLPTIDVLAGLRREGFEPFMACQTRSRDENQRAHTKHMLRLRRPETRTEGEASEVILINSHNGTTSYQMLAGVFRFVCMNGLAVGDCEEIRVAHTGDIVGRVIEGAYSVVKDFERVQAATNEMKAITLAPDESLAFARSALTIRWPDCATSLTPEQVLSPCRSDDAGTDLWTIFNVVQEHLTQGGDSIVNENKRRMRTKAVAAISQSVALNRALWTLAAEMAKLKLAA